MISPDHDRSGNSKNEVDTHRSATEEEMQIRALSMLNRDVSEAELYAALDGAGEKTRAASKKLV